MGAYKMDKAESVYRNVESCREDIFKILATQVIENKEAIILTMHSRIWEIHKDLRMLSNISSDYYLDLTINKFISEISIRGEQSPLEHGNSDTLINLFFVLMTELSSCPSIIAINLTNIEKSKLDPCILMELYKDLTSK